VKLFLYGPVNKYQYNSFSNESHHICGNSGFWYSKSFSLTPDLHVLSGASRSRYRSILFIDCRHIRDHSHGLPEKISVESSVLSTSTGFVRLHIVIQGRKTVSGTGQIRI